MIFLNEKSTTGVQRKKPEPPVDFRLLKTYACGKKLYEQEPSRVNILILQVSQYTLIRIDGFNANINSYLFVICLG